MAFRALAKSLEFIGRAAPGLARNTSDIVAAVRFARAQGLGTSIQSTGHGVVRPANNNLLIITSRLSEVRVDADMQTAWIGAGALWGRLC
ncbi:MAG: FAD-binding protein [Chloroflexi bacterium]|nr:FAD-binding protein [Chloroflexota bacterium]